MIGTEIIETKKSIRQIVMRIKMNLLDENGIHKNYSIFDKFNYELNSTKKFRGFIIGNVIELSGGLPTYWPSVKITLKIIDDGTQIKLKYRHFWIYLFCYLFVVAGTVYDFFIHHFKVQLELLLILIIIPILARWLQLRVKNFLIQ